MTTTSPPPRPPRRRRHVAAGLLTALALSATALPPPATAATAPAGGTPVAPTVTTPDGFATVDALGQNGTTGGAGGPVVTVTTAAQFLDYVSRPGPYVVQVSGTINLPAGANDGMHDVASDKTIVGLGANATLAGGGLNIGLPVDDDVTSPPANAVHNVIIRNLHLTGASDDLINVQMFSHHIWIDHNEFSNGDDGAVDIKRGSDLVTVSWNHFDHSDKSMLIGHSDGSGTLDTGKLKVSIHHNFFDNSRQRHPRIRFAEPVHVYNNYFLGNALYGVASTENAGVVVEGNYFRDVPHPMYSASGYADSGPGRAVQRHNVFVNSGTPETAGAVTELRTYYPYTLDPAANVPALVTTGAGVGRI